MEKTTTENLQGSIENSLDKRFDKDAKLKKVFVRSYSMTHDIDVSIARERDKKAADASQPIYMASVGKMFTATLIGILKDEGKLDFEDRIDKHLDKNTIEDLVHENGEDISPTLEIRNLLNHTSGIADHFWPMLEKIITDKNFKASKTDGIEWAKKETPTKKSKKSKTNYSDTNYHLLGLIIEKIRKKPFHEVFSESIFEPLNMKDSYMLGFSKPLNKRSKPVTKFFFRGRDLSSNPSYANIDYVGGGIVSTLDDMLLFMQARLNNTLVSEVTDKRMHEDTASYGLGIKYGYGVMRFQSVPLLMPKHFEMWGHAGATGAFSFYHEGFDLHIIGTFNDFNYEQRGVRFVLLNVLNPLKKLLK